MTRGRRILVIVGVAIVGLIALLALTPLGQVALVTALNQIETTSFEVRDDELWMNGEINSKTHAQFDEIMAQNPQITTIVEDVVPGSFDDDAMIEFAYAVRERGLNTRLHSQSEIDSGGVDLFLAGIERSMERGAHIGVHSWSDGFKEAAEFPRDAPEHEANRSYIEDMLGADDFYWFTIFAAPADGIHEMTEAEIIEYGLLTSAIALPEETQG